ncbi:MAG: hypothetical protein AAF618_04180 [Pseudomonadota bacterium]
MSKKRWLKAVVAEAKQSGDETAMKLPFTRQARRAAAMEARQPRAFKLVARAG